MKKKEAKPTPEPARAPDVAQAAHPGAAAEPEPAAKPAAVDPPIRREARVPLYYDGSRGPLDVALRNPLQKLKFEGPGIRMVPAADVQDLLTPAIGGGAFSRAIPLADAGAWRPSALAADLEDLATHGKITVAEYRDGLRFLVLDGKTLRQFSTTPMAKEA
jgi:hypothetical protein